MQSMLLLVSRDGQLYQWPWHVPASDIKLFSRVSALNLTNERIEQVRLYILFAKI